MKKLHNNQPEKLQTHVLRELSHTQFLLLCMCMRVDVIPRAFHSQHGFSHIVFVWRQSRYVRCDWETILVRLRPRESTWLDMLLAVESGCFVRTRPECVRRKDGVNTPTGGGGRPAPQTSLTNCWQPRI